MSGTIRPLWRWIPALAWMGVIFYWSSQPSLPGVDWPLSKLAHVMEYSLLAALLSFALANSRRWALSAWIIATLFAASDEFHQSLVPTRHPLPQDVLLDSCAAALAIQLVRFGRAARARRSQPAGQAAPDSRRSAADDTAPAQRHA